jgi:hypothetical protein
MAGVVDALANQPPHNGSVLLPLWPGKGVNARLYRPIQEPGPVSDIKRMATSILDDPPDAASFNAHVILGRELVRGGANHCPLVHMNPLVNMPRNNPVLVSWQAYAMDIWMRLLPSSDLIKRGRAIGFR